MTGLGGDPVPGKRVPIAIGRSVRTLAGDSRRSNTGVLSRATGQHLRVKSARITLLHHNQERLVRRQAPQIVTKVARPILTPIRISAEKRLIIGVVPMIIGMDKQRVVGSQLPL